MIARIVINENAFEQATCVFSSCYSFVIFMRNIVLNVKELWRDVCFCEKVYEKCSVCQMKTIYFNDEYEIYKNSFDLNFLASFHVHLHRNLKKLLKN